MKRLALIAAILCTSSVASAAYVDANPFPGGQLYCSLGGCTLTGPFKLNVSGTVVLDTSSSVLRVRNAANTDWASLQAGALTLVVGGSETWIVDSVGDSQFVSGTELCWSADGIASHSKDACILRTNAGEFGVESAQGGTVYGALAELRLSSTASVNWNTGTKTTLYTVPTGKSAVITKIIYRNASASATTASCGVGFNAGGNDVKGTATHTALTGSTLYQLDLPANGAIVGTATGILGQVCSILQGGALTVTVDVYGYLF